MRYLIELSGECRNLARAESISLCDSPDPHAECDGRALLLSCDIPPSKLVLRLGLAWSVSGHLFSCDEDELDGKLAGITLPGASFRVRASRLEGGHRPGDGTALARRAGKILSPRYRVDLEKPDAELRILMAGKLHAGLLCGEIDRSAFESRKPESRPFKHPITLHPRLARALVNLTGAEEGQAVLDPFCGTGGILLEAGLVGCRVLGGDIDPRMVAGSVLNLEHYGIKKPDIRKMDVSEWASPGEKVDAIATDPPYGRSASTGKEPIESLYARAFAASHDALRTGGRLAIVLPEEKYASLAHGFRLEGLYPVRVHRSLTRYFCLFARL